MQVNIFSMQYSFNTTTSGNAGNNSYNISYAGDYFVLGLGHFAARVIEFAPRAALLLPFLNALQEVLCLVFPE